MHRLTKLAVLAAALAATPLAASARSGYLSTFNSKYGTTGTVLDSCNTCHGSSTTIRNSYGLDVENRLLAGDAIGAALTAVEPLDSDRDTYTNLVEIQARTLPYDAKSFPAPAPVPAPAIAVSPASLAFGTVTVGSSANQTTVVSNAGGADLVVSSVTRCSGTSTEFTASPASFTVAPGGSQTVTVAYAPVDATADAGCVAIASNDAANRTVNVSVSGTGQSQPNPVVDVDITRFSVAKRLDVSRGGATTPKAALVNAGTVAGTVSVLLEGTVPDALGAPTVVYTASQDVTLAAGASTKVSFPTFAATTPETVTWTLTVADQDPDVDVATATTTVVR